MRGFTALEIIVSLAILILLGAMTAGYLSGLKKVITLDGAIESIISLTREAKAKTLAPEDGSQFGVRFESSKATLFKGAAYIEGGADNKIYNLPGETEIFNIGFSGGNLVFKLLTGEPAATGSVSIRLKTDTANPKTIFINNAGLIYVE